MTLAKHNQHGAAEFSALVAVIADGNTATSIEFDEPAYERVRKALSDTSATKLDLALLLRHAVRHESIRRHEQIAVTIPDAAFSEIHLKAAGFVVTRTGSDSLRVEARPWQPPWLPGSSHTPADEAGMLAERKRFAFEKELDGDPFLASVGLSVYRSVGQRAAVRSALSMPPSGKLIIDLPTGEGKSAVFRIIDRIGFSSDAPGANKGVTLVVVPTVTLAFDHERTCGGTPDHPLAYIGGRDDKNGVIKAAIECGAQGLCIASPEAVLGPLSSVLTEAARRGGIRAIIVDEAHLVEAWGTGFRTEFQTLAGQCRKWLELSPKDGEFRTLFLSATLSESARQTLVDLFEPDGDIPLVSGGKIRPEPDYWISSTCDEQSRDDRVLEALHRLPRPAILYVTLVEDAIKWHSLLLRFGFGRIAMVHGQTPNSDREKVLSNWSEGRLDLVVATSAFGLGVDYAHVRSIVHACLPETFDRFYQEVGRAGRDGRATISLLAPTFNDLRLAQSLNRQTVISVDRGLQRWNAMFAHPDVIRFGHPRYGVRLDVAPSHEEADIDLVGERSIDWNARLLVLMARSGLIEIHGPITSAVSRERGGGPWFEIAIANDGHMDPATWASLTQPKRDAIAKGAAVSLQLMKDFLAGKSCPGQLAAALYSGRGRTVALHCSRCAACRINPESRSPEGVVVERPNPWPIAARHAAALTEMIGPNNSLIVEMPLASPRNDEIKDITSAIRRLDRYGVRIFVAVGTPPEWMIAAIEAALRDRPWICIRSSKYTPFVWPTGFRIVLFGKDVEVQPHWVHGAQSGKELIALLPEKSIVPDQPHRLITETAPGPVMGIGEFVERLLL